MKLSCTDIQGKCVGYILFVGKENNQLTHGVFCCFFNSCCGSKSQPCPWIWNCDPTCRGDAKDT